MVHTIGSNIDEWEGDGFVQLDKAISADKAPNGSIFEDSVDNKLKYKNSSGIVQILSK